MKLNAFPNPFSREPATKNGGRPYNQLEGGRQIRDDPFEKQIILLTDPKEEQVLSGKVYTRATLQGRAILTYWDKMWTGKEIHNHMRSTFNCFLGHGIQYELLVPRGKDLVKFENIWRHELNGKYLYKLYARKSIYIRLTEKLQVNSDVPENDQPDNSSYKIPSYSKNLNNKVPEAPKSYIAPKAPSESVSIGQILKQHTEENDIDENMQYAETLTTSQDKMKLKSCPNPFSREPATKNGGRPYNQLEGGRQIRDDPFEKQIILLTDPKEEQVLSGKVYTRATLQGRAILTYWDKMWTGKEIHNHIRSTFNCFLGNGIQYELLVPRGKDLVKFENIWRHELNGKYLYKLYARKSIYIRLTEKLQVNSDVPENDQPDNSSYKIPSYSKNLNNKVPEAPKSYIAPKAPSGSVSIGQILKQHTEENAIDENMQYYIICKKEIWSCVLRTVTRPTFCPLKKPTVMFAEEERSGGALAVKGSTPEFFRLVLLYLKDNMFKGPENAKELNFSNTFLQDGSYYYCGMIIAMSLFHGGPGPSFFSEQFYKCFCEENVNFEKTAAIKNVRQRLEATSNLEQLNHILSILSTSNTYLDQTGCPSTVRDFSRKNSVIQGFMDFHCETEALQQFIDGFQTLTMYTVVQKHYELFQEVFCCKNKKLRASDLDAILKYYYSEEHSETRKMENRTFGFFGQFLQDCQENVVPITLEDVMILITGLECEPPLGFTQPPCVKFLKDPNEKLPIANTSEMSLFLPTVHEFYDNFKTFFCAVWK